MEESRSGWSFHEKVPHNADVVNEFRELKIIPKNSLLLANDVHAYYFFTRMTIPARPDIRYDAVEIESFKQPTVFVVDEGLDFFFPARAARIRILCSERQIGEVGGLSLFLVGVNNISSCRDEEAK